MPAENFVVATQARTLQLTLEGLELAALAWRPDRTGSGLHIAPQWPLPRGKAADVAALRLGFQQAKAKARTAAAEWLARALLDEAAKLDAAETPWPAAQNLRIEASKVLTEVGADAPGAAETTTAMLASALFDIGDGIDSPLATWDQLEAAAQVGCEIGNHTSAHQDLSELDLVRQAQAVAEGDRLLRERRLEPGSVCLPYGKHNAETVPALRAAGATVGYTCSIDPPGHPVWPEYWFAGIIRGDPRGRPRTFYPRVLRAAM